MESNNVRIGSVVIDAKDFRLMRNFWLRALGYVEGRPPEPDDPFPATILKDPLSRGPNVTIDGMEPYRNVIHLDLYAKDYEGEVKRLIGLGATIFRPREPDEDFVVLADPEGNLFCIVDAGP